MIAAFLTNDAVRFLFVVFVLQMLALYKIADIAWHRGYRARRRQDAIRKLS